ncbi:UNVERIFIED_CONTAM: glycosyl transferase family 2 [Acetivibrio alkalicellulosi]
MSLQVLVSTMNQSDHSILQKMNIESDAIVVNQCNNNEIKHINFNNKEVEFMSFKEKGVGLSRNTALMRATADICLFADDDVTYKNDYENIIINEFKSNPKADVIIFNVPSTHSERGKRLIVKRKKLSFFNCFRFGTYQIAIRLESVRRSNIYFSLLFGGGARYSCGEDSLFLNDCLKKGLKIYSSPLIIGTVTHDQSTWFEGYTQKYFFDKGVLYANISKRWARLLIVQFIVRHYKKLDTDINPIELFFLMNKGIKENKRRVL